MEGREREGGDGGWEARGGWRGGREGGEGGRGGRDGGSEGEREGGKEGRGGRGGERGREGGTGEWEGGEGREGGMSWRRETGTNKWRCGTMQCVCVFILKEFGQLKTNAERVAFVNEIPCVHDILVIEPEFSGKSEGMAIYCLFMHINCWIIHHQAAMRQCVL